MRANKARNQKLLSYMQEATERLLERDGFENGWGFKKTQREALQAYAEFLNDKKIPPRERMEGYFDIATGVGKTAIFVALVSMANAVAEEQGEEFRSVIIVPTNVLLKQTAKSFNKIASSTDGNIGFYGDRKRTLSKPITIMTYNAWTKLSAEEKLSAQDVDLLISDEAHRGTSEERTLISKIFNGVVRLAFTATPEFDPDKAVENSHKHEIYSKPLPDAVREGELAAYIQSQLHIIRARPSKKLKDQFGGQEITGEFKRKIRQDAWTRWAVRFYREGRDKQTDDLVSDNQAGFFVDNIDHAISLRKSLNKDPILKKKAKELGYKGVAIEVHSKISSKKVRERIIEDYQAGHYMAIIGDQMLKEGFDHDRMKTVIDWPHGSLVDKLQILGRGARKWFNELKDRWEGLTFADTIVYMGSDDPEKDDYLRKQAIRNAVFASDILDGEAIVSNSTITRKKKRKRKKEEEVNLFLDDDDVEEYTTEGEMKTLLAERSELRRDDYVEITSEMLDHLMSEIERTGIGAKVLLNDIDNIPEGLTFSTINGWKYLNTANTHHWDFVVEKYKDISDNNTLKITTEMRKYLKDEMERTGLGVRSFLKGLEENPYNINSNQLQSWLKLAKSVEPDRWRWVLGQYENLPDDKNIKINSQMRKKLNAERKRTGIAGGDLLKHADSSPDGLTPTIIGHWRSGASRTTEKTLWAWVMEEYKNLPDEFKITTQRRHELKAHKERTGIAGEGLSSMLGDTQNGLKGHLINSWMKAAKTADPELWNLVMLKYEELPNISKRIKITKQKLNQLNKEIKRTQVYSKLLLESSKNDVPEELKVHVINSWKKDVSTVDQKLWNWVMDEYKLLPDAFRITLKLRKEIIDQMNRTGVGSRVLLKNASNVPEGLTVGIIEGWKRKDVVTDPKYWNWVIETYRELPKQTPINPLSKGISPS